MVTVKVYVPAASSVRVVPGPLPVVTIPPGVRVNVHVPDVGSPLSCTLPLESEHFEGVIVPTKGAVGTGGCELITALFDVAEVQKLAVVTVKVYVPGESPENVVVDPFPEDIVPIGLEVITQLSVGGNPLRATLPVLDVHVVCVINPITGAAGIAVITILVVAVTIPQPPAAAIVYVTA